MSVHAIDLTTDGLRLELVTAAAAVRRLVVEDEDGPVDLVLGHAAPADYLEDDGFLGATIGRFGNRIDGGRFTLDGVEHRLSTNQNGNTLHGGARGFDRRVWDVLDSGPDHATFGLVSEDGDQGFPGRLEAQVTYRLAPGEVTISYEARTDAPTVVNLTNHSYFRLDGPGSGRIDDHTVEVAGSAYLPVRDDMIPTGEVRPVDGTAFDLRTATRVGDLLARDDEQLRLAGGIDHTVCLDGSGMRRVARLTGASGRWLEVHTDQPGIQVYSGQHLDDSVLDPSGEPYRPGEGMCLETQGWPDAPNHPHFPSAVLRPGETYRTSTTWRLGRG